MSSLHVAALTKLLATLGRPNPTTAGGRGGGGRVLLRTLRRTIQAKMVDTSDLPIRLWTLVAPLPALALAVAARLLALSLARCLRSLAAARRSLTATLVRSQLPTCPLPPHHFPSHIHQGPP